MKRTQGTTMMRSRGWALVMAATLAAGCGGEGEPGAEAGGREGSEAGAETTAQPSGEMATEFADGLNVRLDEMNETESGLRWRTLGEGEGARAEPGDTAVVHYTGWLPDGTRFDSSRDRGEPFRFVVGRGRVIPGWDEGVARMTVGDTLQLIIPPSLGYGQRGAGNVIPPGATLVFEVELLEVKEGS